MSARKKARRAAPTFAQRIRLAGLQNQRADALEILDKYAREPWQEDLVQAWINHLDRQIRHTTAGENVIDFGKARAKLQRRRRAG